MTKRDLLSAAATLVLALSFAVAGCSDKKELAINQKAGDQVSGAFANRSGNSIADRGITMATPADTDRTAADSAAKLTGVSDMIIVESKVYAVHDKGVVIYDLTDNAATSLFCDAALNAIAYHDGKIYVGGEKLYTLEGVNFEPVDMPFEGTIYDLASVEARLLVGTDFGLYSRSILGDECLMGEVSVCALSPDDSGVWVGTYGQGLYRWDGIDFKKRYLSRDPSLFNFVNALDFNHDHLYVGTDSGLFVFDGGTWETVTTGEGLPSNDIKSIDASGWVALIATNGGVASYFDGNIQPITMFADRQARVVKRLEQKIIVGTEDGGILMKSGPVLKILVDPGKPTDSSRIEILSLSF